MSEPIKQIDELTPNTIFDEVIDEQKIRII